MLRLIKNNQNLFDSFFSDMFDDNTNLMKTDIKESENNYTFAIDLPGFVKEDIKINIEKGYLSVSASKEESVLNEDEKFIRKERNLKSLSRKFYIGNYDLSSLNASYSNGVLEITVDKDKEKEKEYLKIK